MTGPDRGCEARRDDLAAYAIGALSPDEAAEVERHLHECDACREWVRWLAPAVDVLPASVEQRTPPPRLREELMATVRADTTAAASSASRPGAAGPVEGRRDSREGRRGEGRWAGLRQGLLRPAAGFAALILLIVGIGLGYLLRGDQTTEVQSELVRATPLETSVPVSATLERSGDSATLHVQQLPRIPDDEVYEVWVQRAGVMEPRNTFVLGRDGRAEAAIPGPLEGASAVFVTREPHGGSAQPTSDPLLRAPL